MKQCWSFPKEQQKCYNNILMIEYSKINVKLSDPQLKKLKTAVKDKRGTTLRICLKMFNGNDLPH